MPKVDVEVARKTFAALHGAIDSGLVRACHDLSEGGLAVAAAEMAFAGNFGARIVLDAVPYQSDSRGTAAEVLEMLFSESNTRFLVEVSPEKSQAFEAAMAGVPHAMIGEVEDTGKLEILGREIPIPDGGPGETGKPLVVEANLETLKEAWQKPLRW